MREPFEEDITDDIHAGEAATDPGLRGRATDFMLKALVAGTLASGLSGAMVGLLPF